MTSCKICNSELKEDIDKMLLKGCNYKYVQTWVKNRNVTLSIINIKTHATKHLEGFKTTFKDCVKDTVEKVEIQETSDNTFINFEKYCESLGLSPDDFYGLEKNLSNIIYGSQKAISLIFFQNTALVQFKLLNSLNQDAAYPYEAIRGLRSIFEMYTKLLGIENIVNENAAISTLESLGYKISKS